MVRGTVASWTLLREDSRRAMIVWVYDPYRWCRHWMVGEYVAANLSSSWPVRVLIPTGHVLWGKWLFFSQLFLLSAWWPIVCSLLLSRSWVTCLLVFCWFFSVNILLWDLLLTLGKAVFPVGASVCFGASSGLRVCDIWWLGTCSMSLDQCSVLNKLSDMDKYSARSETNTIYSTYTRNRSNII